MSDSNEVTPNRGAAVALASLPLLSFLLQWVFSHEAGTLPVMMRHPTVMIVDWVFVPFNYFVVSVIDWRRGAALYVITVCSVMLNVATHAYWQRYQLDPGHMILANGVTLPAGWAHLSFSILQMVLLVAFVFCRKPAASHLRTATTFALLYFVTMGIAGYVIQGRFILSDAIVSLGGIFLVLFYPRIAPLRQE